MAALTGAVVDDLQHITVTSDSDFDLSDAVNPIRWSVKISPNSTFGDGAAVLVVEAVSNSSTSVTLRAHPELTPGVIYTVEYYGKDSSGNTFTTNSIDTNVVPPSFVDSIVEFVADDYTLAGLLDAIGETISELVDPPTTFLTKELEPVNPDIVFVETTFGFPRYPLFVSVWEYGSIDNRVIHVGEKTGIYGEYADGAFIRMAWSNDPYGSVPAGTPVYADLLSLVPTADGGLI